MLRCLLSLILILCLGLCHRGVAGSFLFYGHLVFLEKKGFHEGLCSCFPGLSSARSAADAHAAFRSPSLIQPGQLLVRRNPEKVLRFTCSLKEAKTKVNFPGANQQCFTSVITCDCFSVPVRIVTSGQLLESTPHIVLRDLTVMCCGKRKPCLVCFGNCFSH